MPLADQLVQGIKNRANNENEVMVSAQAGIFVEQFQSLQLEMQVYRQHTLVTEKMANHEHMALLHEAREHEAQRVLELCQGREAEARAALKSEFQDQDLWAQYHVVSVAHRAAQAAREAECVQARMLRAELAADFAESCEKFQKAAELSLEETAMKLRGERDLEVAESGRAMQARFEQAMTNAGDAMSHRAERGAAEFGEIRSDMREVVGANELLAAEVRLSRPEIEAQSASREAPPTEQQAPISRLMEGKAKLRAEVGMRDHELETLRQAEHLIEGFRDELQEEHHARLLALQDDTAPELEAGEEVDGTCAAPADALLNATPLSSSGTSPIGWVTVGAGTDTDDASDKGAHRGSTGPAGVPPKAALTAISLVPLLSPPPMKNI